MPRAFTSATAADCLSAGVNQRLDAIADSCFLFPESADGAPIKRSCGQMIQEKCRAPEPSGNAAGFIIAWRDVQTHSRIFRSNLDQLVGQICAAPFGVL
jgi:hypothetical protein